MPATISSTVCATTPVLVSAPAAKRSWPQPRGRSTAPVVTTTLALAVGDGGVGREDERRARGAADRNRDRRGGGGKTGVQGAHHIGPGHDVGIRDGVVRRRAAVDRDGHVRVGSSIATDDGTRGTAVDGNGEVERRRRRSLAALLKSMFA